MPPNSPVDTEVTVEIAETTETINELVEVQILKIIEQAIVLQEREQLIDILIFYESIVYLVTSSVSNIVGASDISENSRVVLMYFFLSISILFSCFGIFIKYVKSHHNKDINSYREILKELGDKYGEDAWQAIERGRMKLPASVIVSGFFKGIEPSKGSRSEDVFE